MANSKSNSRHDISNSSLDSSTMGRQATSTLEASDKPPGSVTHPVSHHRPRLKHRAGEGGFQLAPRGKYNSPNEYSLPDGSSCFSTPSNDQASKATTVALQWNIRGLWHNYNDLTIEVARHQPLIIALQETLFVGSDIRAQNLLKNWRFRADPLSRHRNSVCLAVRQDTMFSFLDLRTSLPVVALTMTHPIAATFVSLYLSPQMTADEIQEQLSALLHELPHPFILMGDFNAHSVVWGSSITDRKGVKIEELLASHHLSILNNGDHTRLDSAPGNTSAIDLTITPTNWPPAYNGAYIGTPVGVTISPFVSLAL